MPNKTSIMGERASQPLEQTKKKVTGILTVMTFHIKSLFNFLIIPTETLFYL